MTRVGDIRSTDVDMWSIYYDSGLGRLTFSHHTMAVWYDIENITRAQFFVFLMSPIYTESMEET